MSFRKSNNLLIVDDDFSSPDDANGNRTIYIHASSYSTLIPGTNQSKQEYEPIDFYGEAGDYIFANYDSGYDSLYPSSVGFGTLGIIMEIKESEVLTKEYGQPIYSLRYKPLRNAEILVKPQPD